MSGMILTAVSNAGITAENAPDAEGFWLGGRLMPETQKIIRSAFYALCLPKQERPIASMTGVK